MSAQGRVASSLTPSVARRTVDLLVIVRLPSCVAGAVSVFLGTYLATGTVWLAHGRSMLAGAGIALAVAFANVVNDIVDLRVDAIGKPDRPLPSGRLSLRSARGLAGSLALAAVGFAVLLGALLALWMVGLLGLAAGYSLRFKNTVLLGNIVVALCASMPVAYGAAAMGTFTTAVCVATGLTFLFMLSYETLKTLVDRDGDAAGGLHTFATRRGPDASRRLFRSLILVLTALALAAVATSSTPVAYLVAVTATFIVPSWSTMALLGTRSGQDDLRVPVLLMRVAWFLGIFALWLLR